MSDVIKDKSSVFPFNRPQNNLNKNQVIANPEVNRCTLNPVAQYL